MKFLICKNGGAKSVPEEVDYITAGYEDKTYTVARGGSQLWAQSGLVMNRVQTITYTLRFGKDGTFRTSWSSTSSSYGPGSGVTYALTGYHYY